MTIEFKFKYDIDKLAGANDAVKRALLLANMKIAEKLKATAIKKAPYKTGELMRAIDYENLSVEGFTFVCKVPYAMFLELGTRDHWIEPVDKKALHWTEGGQGKGKKDFFSKGHMVSGIDPHPFMMPSVMENKDKIIATWNEAWKTEFK